MDPTEFNDVYLNDVLDKFSNENKTVVLKGNFKIDLFKYDSNIGSSTFQDKIYSIFLLLYISSPPPPQPPNPQNPITEKLQLSFNTMNKEKFKSELNSFDWPNLLNKNNENTDLSFDLLLENVKKSILKHAELKKVTIQEKNISFKLWITTSILKSIKTKIRIHRKFLRILPK